MSDRKSRSWSRLSRVANAIRVPSGDQTGSSSGRRSVGQAARLARLGVDDPDVGDGVVDELRPVEHVVEPIDVAVVRLGRGGRVRLGLRGRGPGGPPSGSRRASWSSRAVAARPATTRSSRRRAAGRSGAAPRRRRARAGGSGCRPRAPSCPSAGPGSSSTWKRRSLRNATVRPSGEKRPCRSCFDPIVSWRGSAGAFERDEPERVAVAVVARRATSGP